MTEEEKKLQFEQEIQKMSVAEYHAYVDDCNAENPLSRVKSEKDARMFYYAMRLGVRRGMNYMAHQYQELLRNQQEEKDGSNN
jgi:hypothetical protein